MVGITHGKNLRLGFQAPKRARMNDAVAISRIFAAITMPEFGKAPPARMFGAHGPAGWRRRNFRGAFCGWDKHSCCPPLAFGFLNAIRVRIQLGLVQFQDFGAMRANPLSASSAM